MDRPFDIPDSTDWLTSSLPGVAPLESALRCQICKDFFNNPVITSCSHTFCSLCIRRCLSSEGKCPACRATDQLLKLRRNWAVQEILESFQNARPNILALARQAQTTTLSTDKTKEEEDTEMSHPATKKRRLNQSDDAQPEMRRTRSQGRQLERQPMLVGPESIDDSKDEDYMPDDGLVPCPMCNRRMKEAAVFNHLDNCKGSIEENALNPHTSYLRQPQHSFRSSQNKSPAKPLERLPTMNYSLIKDNMLRKKLKELGIPDWGPRAILQRRHTEWMNLWNANCDAKVPKTKDELRRDLDVWERTQGGAAPQPGSSSGPNAVMAKTFDAAAWSANHDDDFKRLIENARKKKDMRKIQTQDKEEENDNSTSQQDDNAALNNANGENHTLPTGEQPMGNGVIAEPSPQPYTPLNDTW
ncbi:DNA repair protein (RadR), putative [Talaromyces stipitatus ATCC 10500]|uniref:Postreplication repair E3 ubiquitin-protein ligase RAD18 n=1 Tax=Talaromyces stipitatus (strain ATCC 10500 / CBS 375.48 / QM 6759 / NRRL 1006) TaxID=441959 RepID=B8MR11_TALSN|nr:DNA repair protein (RadR), putative [Talaromyces stipitatus ATCC 10500]EED12846.1 DNA repair protein (RadR), putative [Talaromyces stipitatus ATCC 10500]